MTVLAELELFAYGVQEKKYFKSIRTQLRWKTYYQISSCILDKHAASRSDGSST